MMLYHILINNLNRNVIIYHLANKTYFCYITVCFLFCFKLHCFVLYNSNNNDKTYYFQW